MVDDESSIMKQIMFDNASGDKFIILVSRIGEFFQIQEKDVPETLSSELRQTLTDATSTPLAEDRVSEVWVALLESFQAKGWIPHELMTSTMEFSLSDGRFVSRLTAPNAPSENLQGIHRNIHTAIAGMFGRIASEAAAEVRRLVGEGLHIEAFAKLREAESRGVFYGGPSPDLIDALCLIDRTLLSPNDAFTLWQIRINEKSKGRVYQVLEDDLQILESEFSSHLTPRGEESNRRLLIRAEIAEYSGKREVAYARYRELIDRGDLDPALRAYANWGVFRMAARDDFSSARYAQLAADAFLEAGERNQASKCYASAAKAFEVTDLANTHEMIDKALQALEEGTALSADSRAGLLHFRADMLFGWGQLDEAFRDASEAIQIRKRLTGVEGELLASLHLAKLIADRRNDIDMAQQLEAEIEPLKTRADADSQLCESLAACPLDDIDQLRAIHKDIIDLKNPRTMALSLLKLGCAHVALSLPDALEYLESALDIAQRNAILVSDIELHALIESAIGQSYMTYGDMQRAIEWFKKAVAHDPREATARQNLGALLLEQERWSELIALMETQLHVFGELPGILFGYGRALLGSGRPSMAGKMFYRAKAVCEDPALLRNIEEWLDKAMKEPQETNEERKIPQKISPVVSREDFAAAIQSFGDFVKSERRMSFWRVENKVRKLTASPEQHAKFLLHSFLRGRLGDGVTILDELVAGAGLLDLWIEVLGGSRYVVELKMCGESYATGYAAKGVEQLIHYMENKKTHLGYLLVFDCRRRDFGKGIDPEIKTGANTITTKFIDIRPDVIRASDESDDE